MLLKYRIFDRNFGGGFVSKVLATSESHQHVEIILLYMKTK